MSTTLPRRSSPNVKDFLKPLAIDDATLDRLAYRFSATYSQLAASSFDQFFPTAVTRLPTGQETGNYLAVYLGLYYLHVAFIDLLGQPEGKLNNSLEKQPVRRTLEKAWPLGEHLRKDSAPAFFAWIGDCIAEVVADSLTSSSVENVPAEITMGISFCFPLMQKSLDEAILMPTDKGFALASDLNLRQALLDGYECHTRRSDDDEYDSKNTRAKRQRKYALPKLKIAAMTNDTVATLASLAYSIRSLPNTRVVMSLIVGAGCNSTVSMRLSDLHKTKTRHILAKDPGAKETLVCTEWTLYGSAPPIRELGLLTKWDTYLDKNSKKPGFQPLEYMTGGRYIGELVRIICYDYFNGVLGIPHSELPSKVVEEYTLTTDFLSLVVASSLSDENLTTQLSQQLPFQPSSGRKWTQSTARDLRAIASAVQTRAAALVAASTVGLLACSREIQLRDPDSISHTDLDVNTAQQTIIQNSQSAATMLSRPDWRNGPEELVVAVSGGVFQHYPNYKETVQRYIDHLLIRGGPQDGGKSIFLREASDGGIIGVGVVAGTVTGMIEGIVVSSLEQERKSREPEHAIETKC